MKYYIIAGERSGDLHASNLLKQIKVEDKDAQFRGMGGDLMKKAGAEIFCDYNAVSYMGFLEVVLHLAKIFQVMNSVKMDLLKYHPDVLILVDFAGFNMKIAAFAKKHQIPVYYYISPKIWAWNQKRAYKIKKHVDRMFVILPFEKEFYKKFDFEVDYIGNPVNDAVNNFIPDSNVQSMLKQSGKPVIALLPGSRKQEVLNMLEILKEVSAHFPAYEFVIAGVSNLPQSLYESIPGFKSIKLVIDQTYNLLSIAEAAVVTSGTATLETALLGVPQVVVYKTSGISYAIAKMLIKVKFISLVNLIAGKEVVKELIQKDFSSANIIAELSKIITNSDSRKEQLKNYSFIRNLLGTSSASENAARLMVQYLQTSKRNSA